MHLLCLGVDDFARCALVLHMLYPSWLPSHSFACSVRCVRLAQVVSGTPGRVFDMIRRRNLRTRDLKVGDTKLYLTPLRYSPPY